MESINLASKYKKLIQDELSITDLTLILYGSTVYGVNTSDLDICFISNVEFDNKIFDELKKLTLWFHNSNRLRIDEEILFEDKLLYSKAFVESAITDLPFPMINERYIISPIEKTREFLSSIEMKKRLILNILTTKRKILFGDQQMVNDFSKRAWEEIIKIVILYCRLNGFKINDFIDVLYKDPYNNNFGEMYLGYKDNFPEKREYLETTLESVFDDLTQQKKLTMTNKIYIPNKKWLSGI